MQLIQLFSFSFLMLLSSLSFAQTQVEGVVTDKDGNPLSGVSVAIAGDARSGVSTNTDGHFTISSPDLTQTLRFTYIGMKPHFEELQGRSSLSIVLEDDLHNLSEVVVIGYGQQSRSTLTTSISKVDDKVLENVPFSNPAAALQGSVSGLRVQSTSGQPGQAPRVILRGSTSINDPNGSAPLYLIDGVIRNNMDHLNTDDIESIQVLKDAAATSIYGARGSNGVILVTTKSGKSGTSTISYRYDLTASQIGKRYDLVSAEDYIYYQRLGIAARGDADPTQLEKLSQASSAGTGNDLTKNTAFTTQYLTPQNEHKLLEGWQSMPDPIDPTKTIIFKDTDFQDVLFRTGISHNHSINASGGTDRATFNAGVGYLTNEGIAITTNYKRLSVNLNGDLKVRDNMSVFGRVLYTNSGDRQVSNMSNIFSRSIAIPATTKYMYEDGTLAPGLNASIGNAAYHLNTQEAKNSLSSLTLALGGRWEILPGFAFEPQVSLYTINADNRFFQKAYFNGPLQFVDNRAANGASSKQVQHQADALFTYVNSINNEHNFDVIGGFSYFGRMNSGLSASGQGAASDLIPTLNASGTPVSVGGTESEQIITGFLSRVNYDYKQKYLFSVNARYDGASNLGENHKWGFFPGISLGWNMHNEEFWASSPLARLMQLKLRASYGVNGNISGLGPYQAQGQYAVGQRYGGYAAVQSTVLPNSNLKWEQSKTLNFGADLGLWNNRLTVLVDVYNRVTDNLLTSMSLPHSTGFTSILTNLGSLQNRGIDLEVSANVLGPSSPVQWNIGFNASKVKNKILRLPDNGIENNRIGGVYVWDPARSDYAWLGGLQEGGTIGDAYAYKQLGIYSTDEEAANGPVDMIIPGTDKTKYGGSVNWLDVDNNGLIEATDRVHVGNIFPVWTGGFSTSVAYKNVALSVRMDYTSGHTIYHYTWAQGIGQFVGENGLVSDVLQSWQKPGDITDVPRVYWADQQAQNNLFRGNSRYYERGDFLALRELTLSYTVPSDWLRVAKLSSLRVNLTGNNLHYFTSYKGLNPEEGGDDRGRYPVPRNFILGVSASF